MSIKFLIKTDSKAARQFLKDSALRLKDRRTPNRMVSVYLYQWVMQNFDSEGRKTGTRWKELSPRTIRARLGKSGGSKKAKKLAYKSLAAGKRFFSIRNEQIAMSLAGKIGKPVSIKILQDTGNLRQSFKPFSDNNVAGVGAQASYGVDYSKAHEYGDPKNHIPQRRMLPRPQEVERDVLKIYNKHVSSITARAK